MGNAEARKEDKPGTGSSKSEEGQKDSGRGREEDEKHREPAGA